MGNIIAILLGVLVLPIVILGTIPFLGWANWLALPVLVLGIVAGQLSSSGNAGTISASSSASLPPSG